MASDAEYQYVLSGLVNLVRESKSVMHVADAFYGYPPPYSINDVVPDVIAEYTGTGQLVIGVAETSHSYTTEAAHRRTTSLLAMELPPGNWHYCPVWMAVPQSVILSAQAHYMQRCGINCLGTRLKIFGV